MLSFLKTLFSREAVKEMLKAWAKLIAVMLRQRGAMWARDNVIGKFAHVATIGGRVYAAAFTDSEVPPEGHPNAWHLLEVDLVDIFVHIWGVSFPKKRWAEMDAEKVLRVRW